MTRDDIQLLMAYDRWANRRVLRAGSALSAEEFTRELGGGFGSVRGTLVHILGGEWGWLTFWKEASPGPGFLKDLWTRHDDLFDPLGFAEMGAVERKWAEVEKEQDEFLDGLTDESLEKLLPVRDTGIRLAHLMQHLANHSSYHRGQVALMMRLLGAKPVATDFHLFLLERPSEAAAKD